MHSVKTLPLGGASIASGCTPDAKSGAMPHTPEERKERMHR
jgi:hypothetical protein